jgi:hypothetical protein
MAAEQIADHIDQDPDPHDEKENSYGVSQKIPKIKAASKSMACPVVV